MKIKRSFLNLCNIFHLIVIAVLIIIPVGCRKANSSRFLLGEVANFGSNPGGLEMFKYIPSATRTKNPLVVVLHGCTQSAQDFADHSGWPEMADKMKFILVFPQQSATNNLAKCFHWYREKDNRRDSGEALSIKQMVDRMEADYKIDARKVYVTGLSAGAAMTGVMLATYPDVFAGGAMMAGVPYGCATQLSESLDCMQSRAEKTPAQWGDLVRHATDRRSTWPVVSIWQGTADHIIAPGNAQQEMEQWTNVHGLSQTPTTTDTVAGFPHEVFRNRDGKNVVELYSITDMGHGQAVNPGSESQHCGSTETFFYDVHLCFAYQVAKFWGIDR